MCLKCRRFGHNMGACKEKQERPRERSKSKPGGGDHVVGNGKNVGHVSVQQPHTEAK